MRSFNINAPPMNMGKPFNNAFIEMSNNTQNTRGVVPAFHHLNRRRWVHEPVLNNQGAPTGKFTKKKRTNLNEWLAAQARSKASLKEGINKPTGHGERPANFYKYNRYLRSGYIGTLPAIYNLLESPNRYTNEEKANIVNTMQQWRNRMTNWSANDAAAAVNRAQKNEKKAAKAYSNNNATRKERRN